jgi:hypothetical protein
VLGDLADEYPLLTTLVDRTAGGQRRLPFGDGPDQSRSGVTAAADEPVAKPAPSNGEPTDESEPALAGDAGSRGEKADTKPRITVTVHPPGKGRRKKPATLSIQIRFENLEGNDTLARLIESTVWVNDAHPAYRRAAASRAEAYHIALSVAAALAPLAVEPERAQTFISAFLARWGEAANGRRAAGTD